MYCGHCGNYLAEGSAVCPRCGTQVAEEASAQTDDRMDSSSPSSWSSSGEPPTTQRPAWSASSPPPPNVPGPSWSQGGQPTNPRGPSWQDEQASPQAPSWSAGQQGSPQGPSWQDQQASPPAPSWSQGQQGSAQGPSWQDQQASPPAPSWSQGQQGSAQGPSWQDQQASPQPPTAQWTPQGQQASPQPPTAQWTPQGQQAGPQAPSWSAGQQVAGQAPSWSQGGQPPNAPGSAWGQGGGQVAGQSAASAFNFDSKRWKRSDWIAGIASLVVLISLFLPWFNGSVSANNDAGLAVQTASESGMDAHGWLWLVFVVALLILAFLVLTAGFRVLPFKIPLSNDQVLLIATGVNLLLVLVGFLLKPSTGGLTGVSIDWGIGAYLDLVAALVALAVLTPPGRQRVDSAASLTARRGPRSPSFFFARFLSLSTHL